jgi:hypothetical protein
VKILLVEKGFTKVEIGRKLVFGFYCSKWGSIFLWVQNWSFGAIKGETLVENGHFTIGPCD